jgi:hypothetical protein
MNTVAVNHLPTQPLIDSDLTECLSGVLPVLMADGLNAKRTDWNSWLIRDRDAFLRDYADRIACLIYGPDSPTTVTYLLNTNPDVLDIVFIKDFVLTMYLTAALLSAGITYMSR